MCVADIRCRIKTDQAISLTEESALPELKLIIRDCAIAIEHILLEAESMGLASCWTADFKQEEMRPVLGIPEDKYVVGVITIGYSKEMHRATQRRSLESMIRYEKW